MRRLRFFSMLVAAVAAHAVAAGAAAEPLHLETTPISLHDEDSSVDRVGSLTFLGGLRLSSSHQQFGGLSGLAVSPNGRRLTFVTDDGSWIRAVPTYDSQGRLIGIASAEIGRLLRPDGQPVRGKREGDAESLSRTRGGFLVSFEHQHRFWLYDGGPNPFLNQPGIIAAPRALGGRARNRGIEAATLLDDGRLFALAENFPRDVPHVMGWVRERERWRALTYERTALFHPAGAATLPDGDVLILERRFTYVGGFASRLVRVPLASLQSAEPISGRELARLEPPLVEENFEGMDVRRDAAGRTLVYLISDDNFFPLQRTLLLLFAIRP
jgi:hypothetical protein